MVSENVNFKENNVNYCFLVMKYEIFLEKYLNLISRTHFDNNFKFVVPKILSNHY